MGCGGAKATKADAPPSAQKVDQNNQGAAPEAWATKTPAGKAGASQTVQTSKGSSQQPGSKAVVLEDADDEIEIVDEGPSKQQQQPRPEEGGNRAKSEQVQRQVVSSANPSEAPQWGGDATGVKDQEIEPAGAAPKPLPKQQAEEAAKLAETRKRFDNQRYHANSSSNAMPPGDVAAVPLSLNNTISTPKEQGNLGKLGAFELPGGVADDDLDELELNEFVGAVEADARADEKFQVAQPASQKEGRYQHDFNADDEALMNEILEDFEDI